MKLESDGGRERERGISYGFQLVFQMDCGHEFQSAAVRSPSDSGLYTPKDCFQRMPLRERKR